MTFPFRVDDTISSRLKVKIGMAWPVNSNGPADAEAFVVISTLQHYLRCNLWVGIPDFVRQNIAISEVVSDHVFEIPMVTWHVFHDAVVTIFPRRFGARHKSFHQGEANGLKWPHDENKHRA
jgi:hypothetical protein